MDKRGLILEGLDQLKRVQKSGKIELQNKETEFDPKAQPTWETASAKREYNAPYYESYMEYRKEKALEVWYLANKMKPGEEKTFTLKMLTKNGSEDQTLTISRTGTVIDVTPGIAGGYMITGHAKRESKASFLKSFIEELTDTK